MATFRASTKTTVGAGTGTTPTGTASGDLFIMAALNDGTGAFTPDESWDHEHYNGNEAMGSQMGVWSTTLAGAPAGSYGVSNAAGDTGQGIILLSYDLGGETIGAKVVSTIASGSAATITTGAVTGVEDPSELIAIFGNDANSAIVTPPADMTLVEHLDGASTELAVYRQQNPGTGSIQKALEWSTATNKLALLLLIDLTPAAGGANAVPLLMHLSRLRRAA